MQVFIYAYLHLLLSLYLLYKLAALPALSANVFDSRHWLLENGPAATTATVAGNNARQE